MIAAVRKSRQIVQLGPSVVAHRFIRMQRSSSSRVQLAGSTLVKITGTARHAPTGQFTTAGNRRWKRFLVVPLHVPLEPRRFRWCVCFGLFRWDDDDNGCHFMDLVQWLCDSEPSGFRCLPRKSCRDARFARPPTYSRSSSNTRVHSDSLVNSASSI